ncbi:MAG: sugar phosphate isomerase/epimerase family protein [Planctomycetota bacterium]
MEKVLNQCGLGAGSRQSEIIELALTHRFDGIEVDMADLLARYEAMGKAFALQFFKSARVKTGTFKLPINPGVGQDEFPVQLTKLEKVIELAKELGCTRCYLEIESGSDRHTFLENFENHRVRLSTIGGKLAEAGIRLGIGLSDNIQQCKKTYQFVRSAEELLTLLRMVGHPNVGLCVNTFNWALGKGKVEQLAALKADKVSEVRLGDIPDGADLAKVTSGQVQLAGSQSGSFAISLMKFLHGLSWDGAVSMLAGSAMFTGKARDAVFAEMAARLQELVEIGEGKRDGLEAAAEVS